MIRMGTVVVVFVGVRAVVRATTCRAYMLTAVRAAVWVGGAVTSVEIEADLGAVCGWQVVAHRAPGALVLGREAIVATGLRGVVRLIGER